MHHAPHESWARDELMKGGLLWEEICSCLMTGSGAGSRRSQGKWTGRKIASSE